MSLNFTLLTSLLIGEAHSAVDDGEEVGGLGELRHDTVEQVGGGEEVVVGVSAQVPLFEPQQVVVLCARGEALRGAGERLAMVEVEAFGTLNGGTDSLGIVQDLLADALQHVPVEAVGTCAQHITTQIVTALRLNVEVVARIAPFLTVGSDKDPEVRLVGSLVGRETRVAIDAVGAVAEAQTRHRAIYLAHTGDERLGKGVEGGLRSEVLLLVLCKPLAIVILAQRRKK